MRAPAATSLRRRFRRLRADGKPPVRPYEVAGISARITLQVVLVLGLRLPELRGGHHFGDDLARPEARRLDVRDRVLGNALLFFSRVKNRRPIAGPDVVPCRSTVVGSWIWKKNSSSCPVRRRSPPLRHAPGGSGRSDS